jgi:hypothetical protein
MRKEEFSRPEILGKAKVWCKVFLACVREGWQCFLSFLYLRDRDIPFLASSAIKLVSLSDPNAKLFCFHSARTWIWVPNGS